MTYSENWAQSERNYLCDLLDEVGPNHPTLCAGWTTADLAAHIVLRERRPDAAIGIVVSAVANHTQTVMDGYKGREWSELVGLIRQGAPRWNPMSFGPVNLMANTLEFFVHVEDVRRCIDGWTERQLPGEYQELLWSRLRTTAPLLWRKATVAVTLDNGESKILAKKNPLGPGVVVHGEVSELVLKSYGRSACHVTVTGDDASIALFNQTDLSA